ncbi:hypothetical protein HS5_14870 [Acidianus sp. HS-5]|nr:hypothetical protein HS5_14870 [Acidianus sp. HS-5]
MLVIGAVVAVYVISSMSHTKTSSSNIISSLSNLNQQKTSSTPSPSTPSNFPLLLKPCQAQSELGGAWNICPHGTFYAIWDSSTSTFELVGYCGNEGEVTSVGLPYAVNASGASMEYVTSMESKVDGSTAQIFSELIVSNKSNTYSVSSVNNIMGYNYTIYISSYNGKYGAFVLASNGRNYLAIVISGLQVNQSQLLKILEIEIDNFNSFS